MLRTILILLAFGGSALAADKRVTEMPPATDPLPTGTCLHVVRPGVDSQLCQNPTTNLGMAFGISTAPANTIFGNFSNTDGFAAPTSIPPCPDSVGAHVNIDAGGPFYCGTSAPPTPAALARTQKTNLSFTGTGATELMAGFGAAGLVITPVATGRFLFRLTGATTTTATAPSSALTNFKIYYGTGTAPAAGSAPPSPCVSPTCFAVTPVVGISGDSSQVQSVSLMRWVTSVTNGTQYWVDVSLQDPVIGNSIVQSADSTLIEQ